VTPTPAAPAWTHLVKLFISAASLPLLLFVVLIRLLLTTLISISLLGLLEARLVAFIGLYEVGDPFACI
jgi:hypothetical protein